MKTHNRPFLLTLAALLVSAAPLLAQSNLVVDLPPRTVETQTMVWHSQSLWHALGNMLIFALVGVLVAVAGFKIFDKCTPGDLAKEIVEHKNVAAAIVAGAVILGVCLIVAAAIVG